MIKSVVKMGDVLDALAEARQDVGLSEIAVRSGLQSGQAHKYLASMIEIGIAEQDPRTGKYRLGPAALKVGLSALARQDILSTTQSAVKAFCEDQGLTGHVAVWGPSGPVIVALYRAGSPFVTTLGLGVVAPLTTSATGLIFLAFSSPSLVKSVLEGESGDAPTATEAMEGRIAEIRETRSAFVSGTMIPGLCARSAPILNLQNEVACSVTLVSSSETVLTRDSEATNALHDLCRTLSSRFGATI
ncbi:MAG: IclR family transcriptional regulator [Roseibium sp.]|nr:IclR family transcriptional regulator [Roseibium sp.]